MNPVGCGNVGDYGGCLPAFGSLPERRIDDVGAAPSSRSFRGLLGEPVLCLPRGDSGRSRPLEYVGATARKGDLRPQFSRLGGIFVLCANGVGPFHSGASGIAFAAAACLVVLNTASLLAKIWVRPVNKSWSFDLLTFDEAVPWFHALVAAGAVTALLLSPPNGWAIVSVLGVLFVLCVVHEVLFNIVPVLYLPPRATDEDHPRGDDDRE